MPALLKAFLEQVRHPGIAFRFDEGGTGFTKTLLKGRSARLVVAMAMPPMVYRLWFLGHGIAGLRRSILNFCRNQACPRDAGRDRDVLPGDTGTGGYVRWSRSGKWQVGRSFAGGYWKVASALLPRVQPPENATSNGMPSSIGSRQEAGITI